MQGGMTPSGNPWNQHLMGGNVYLNCDGNSPGEGGVNGQTDCSVFDVVFSYPEDEWFKVTCIYDLDAETWGLNINDIPQFDGYPLAFNNYIFEGLAGIDYYSASTNNHMYIDDLIGGPGILGVEDFNDDVFTVYPNPVQDILNISTKSVVDVLGKVVLQARPDAVSPQIDMSSLPSGTYMVKVTIDKNSKIVKILK